MTEYRLVNMEIISLFHKDYINTGIFSDIEVNKEGKVRSFANKVDLQVQRMDNGFNHLNIMAARESYRSTDLESYRVDAMILSTFGFNFEINKNFLNESGEYLEVHHLNGDDSDDRIDNLTWITSIKNLPASEMESLAEAIEKYGIQGHL